jgi:peptidoglycan/xylan/chitin deacetylase (PgdA/CDA1 family)
MIRVALRFDDPSATSDHALEAAIFQKLERHGVPITVAAIPYRQRNGDYVALSADHAGHLLQARRAGVIEIALHGYSHEERGGSARGAPSEFAGVPAAEQRRLIEAGRAVLKDAFGCNIAGFVPPFNTCDAMTVAALHDLGFTYLSAGLDAPRDPKLAWLPRSCQMVDIQAAVVAARRDAWLGPVVIGVMHHYDFHESGSPQARIDLAGFAERLAWIAAQPDIEVLTLDGLARACCRHTHLSQLRGLHRLLPWRLRQRLPVGHLLPVPNLSCSFH